MSAAEAARLIKSGGSYLRIDVDSALMPESANGKIPLSRAPAEIKSISRGDAHEFFDETEQMGTVYFPVEKKWNQPKQGKYLNMELRRGSENLVQGMTFFKSGKAEVANQELLGNTQLFSLRAPALICAEGMREQDGVCIARSNSVKGQYGQNKPEVLIENPQVEEAKAKVRGNHVDFEEGDTLEGAILKPESLAPPHECDLVNPVLTGNAADLDKYKTCITYVPPQQKIQAIHSQALSLREPKIRYMPPIYENNMPREEAGHIEFQGVYFNGKGTNQVGGVMGGKANYTMNQGRSGLILDFSVGAIHNLTPPAPGVKQDAASVVGSLKVGPELRESETGWVRAHLYGVDVHSNPLLTTLGVAEVGGQIRRLFPNGASVIMDADLVPFSVDYERTGEKRNFKHVTSLKSNVEIGLGKAADLNGHFEVGVGVGQMDLIERVGGGVKFHIGEMAYVGAGAEWERLNGTASGTSSGSKDVKAFYIQSATATLNAGINFWDHSGEYRARQRHEEQERQQAEWKAAIDHIAAADGR